ncbi:hypothetical protein GGI22_006991 [Coemansia erecta]|nr:hypothetical protein GGI22_006991 [Coemansia erecta]
MRVVVAALALALTVVVHLYINDVYMPAISHLPVRKAVDAARNPHVTEFPNVLSGYRRAGCGADAVARNRVYAMYSSLVPVCVIDAVLLLLCAKRTTPATNGWDNHKQQQQQSDEADVETKAHKRCSMGDRRPQASMADNELARMFANPAVRAKPVCSLWVPLANTRLFARLVWDVERLGQGTILVITQGAWIDEKTLTVKADLDFVVEDYEVSDKAELAFAQQNRARYS